MTDASTRQAPNGAATLASTMPLARGPAWANRITLAPLTNWQSHADGTLGDDEYRWLTMRSQGGFGMTMTCAAHVQASGQGFPGQLGVWSDAHLPGLSRLAQGIRAAGSVSCLQLQHSGRRADTALSGRPTVAPWADAETGARALSTAEVQQLVQDFISAARRAERAGFEGVELHAAHGYLLAQFLDTEHNQRTDQYGGSAHNRNRILFELIAGVRAATGPGFQLGLRLSPERFGITMAESLALAQQVLDGGVSLVFGDDALARKAAEGADRLYIHQMGHVQSHFRIVDQDGHPPANAGVKQQFDDGRRVEHDHRASRSSRMTSAALRRSLRGAGPRSRARMSCRVGRSSALPTSRRM